MKLPGKTGDIERATVAEEEEYGGEEWEEEPKG